MIRLVRKIFTFAVLGVLFYSVDAYFTQGSKEKYSVVISQGEIEAVKKAFLSRVSRQPTSLELDNLIAKLFENRILVSEALRLGLYKNDPVVRERLRKNLDFLGLLQNSRSSHSRVEDEMILKDAVVKRRMLERMQALLVSQLAYQNPSDQDLLRFYNENADEYSSDFQFRLSHRFEPIEKQQDKGLIITSLANPESFYSVNALRKILPNKILKQIEASKEPRDLEFVSVEGGVHKVKILEVQKPKVLAYELVSAKVRQDYYQLGANNAIREYIEQVKPHYRLVIND